MISIFKKFKIIINNIYVYDVDNWHDNLMFYWISETETDPDNILTFFEIKNDVIFVYSCI